jgi:hypothetical protein
MTNEGLFAILRPIVMTVTGVPECILADQNVKAPSGAYATIRPRQAVTERGQANIYDEDIPDDKVLTNARAQVIATCSINFYRGDAMMYAERLKQCNKRPDVSMTLFKAKLGWLGTDPVNNLTALQSANWEQRSNINVRIMYEVDNIAEINNILHFALELQNEKGQVLATFSK